MYIVRIFYLRISGSVCIGTSRHTDRKPHIMQVGARALVEFWFFLGVPCPIFNQILEKQMWLSPSHVRVSHSRISGSVLQERLATLEADRKTIMMQVGVRARIQQLKADQKQAEETSSQMYVLFTYTRLNHLFQAGIWC